MSLTSANRRVHLTQNREHRDWIVFEKIQCENAQMHFHVRLFDTTVLLLHKGIFFIYV